MNYIILKRTENRLSWEFVYENNVHGPGYYYLSNWTHYKTILYRIEFSWQFVESKGHTPEIRIMRLNDDGIHWTDATTVVDALSIKLGKGVYFFSYEKSKKN